MCVAINSSTELQVQLLFEGSYFSGLWLLFGNYGIYIPHSSNHLLLVQCSCSEESEEGSQLLFSDPGDNNKDVDEHLWVEKYSPKHYTELLSDDVCDII